MKSTANDKNMVKAPSTKPNLGKKISQPITGKLKGMTSMGKGDPGLGQAVKTVKSNPIQGKKSAQPKNTAMGNGGVIDPFV